MDSVDIFDTGLAIIPWAIGIGAVAVLIAFARWIWCLV